MNELREQLQQLLGDTYRLERELTGGMSRVFVAEEIALERKVVIKVLPPETVATVNVARFRREIQLAASLQHPHIVPLLTAGARGDLLYYVMPLIEGESLRSRLVRSGELPVSDVASILGDTASALAYAHNHGVVRARVAERSVNSKLGAQSDGAADLRGVSRVSRRYRGRSSAHGRDSGRQLRRCGPRISEGDRA
ncbi:MAG: protein kinase [Gemmatimonadales bacterium]